MRPGKITLLTPEAHLPAQVDGLHLLNSKLILNLHGFKAFKSWFFDEDSRGNEVIL